MGGARNSVRVAVIAMSDWFKGPGSPSARCLNVKGVESGKIERQDIQVLQVMTDEERTHYYDQRDAELDAKEAGKKYEPTVEAPKKLRAETPTNMIARRDTVARVMAADFGTSIAQARRNLRQVEQTIEKLLLAGNRIVLMDFMAFDTVRKIPKEMIDLRTRARITTSADFKLKTSASRTLATKIKEMEGA
jgi:nucleoid DNA-binding protein